MNPLPAGIRVAASVYRLQLSSKFTIGQARKILPYLKELGVEAVYCSPYFKAFSDHGYDVTDPNCFNGLLGSVEEYFLFCRELKELKLDHIIDVVPNHMGIKGGENRWWQDVLENGPFSEYAFFFDINFSPEKRELQDKVLLPILGSDYGKALENQEIMLDYSDGRFFFRCSEFILPVAPHCYCTILESGIEKLRGRYREDSAVWIECQSVIELYRRFPTALEERKQKKEEGKKRLIALLKNKKIYSCLIEQIRRFNGKKNNPESFNALDSLLETQFYRLSYWRVARYEINYRRFFNVNELVAIRIEKEQVLKEHHQWVFELIEQGHVQGLRIDHPDGLYDPVGYFKQLRTHGPVYTVVEKILGRREPLPLDWEVEGTVGYEYLNMLNGLFIDQYNEKAITALYESFIEREADFEEIVYSAKKFFTSYEMVSEIEALGLRLDRLSETNRAYRDFTRNELTQALSEVIACFPVYRSYISPKGKLGREDGKRMKIAIEKAKKRAPELDLTLFDFLEKVLLLKVDVRADEAGAYRDFVLSFQQLTGPIMAKGLEDTAFYLYNRLISLNEVGGYPPYFGRSVAEFHRFLLEKRKLWPYGFLATSTHDTKRSEDVRMRLNVLSELPAKWALILKKLSRLSEKYKREKNDFNTEYYIYQTLLGVWPRSPFKKGEYPRFCERIWGAVLKSIREAKEKTNWLNPCQEYEENIKFFLLGILNDSNFIKEFMTFHKLIDRYGALNSLSSMALKIASPGVVDLYQGNELLNYRLVDPDNRGSVSFHELIKQMQKIKQVPLEALFANRDLSRAKFSLQLQGLHFRKANRSLFLDGTYIPLKVRGVRKRNVVAFMRKLEKQFLIVAVARFFADLAPNEWDLPLGRSSWGDTELLLPSSLETDQLSDLFTERQVTVRKRGSNLILRLAEVFAILPFSYLKNS